MIEPTYEEVNNWYFRLSMARPHYPVRDILNGIQYFGAAREALAAEKPAATRGDIERFLSTQVLPDRMSLTRLWVDFVYAVLSHFSAPARQDVPDVEEIEKAIDAGSSGRLPESGRIALVSVAARIAHDMMRQLMPVQHASDCAVNRGSAYAPAPCNCGVLATPRQRMQIEGLSREELQTIIHDGCPVSFVEAALIASVVYGLANTPAETVDPDAGAKRLWRAYNNVTMAATNNAGLRVEWGSLPDESKAGWRAVAAAKGEKG